MAIIDEFAAESNLDRELKLRLRHALSYSTEKTGFTWADKQHIFNELPRNLKYEVAMVMHKGACKEIGFFKNKDTVFIYSIVPFLQYHYVTMHEIIYKEEDYADEMYFIHRGRINFIYCFQNEKYVYKSLPRGSYFGDIELVT